MRTRTRIRLCPTRSISSKNESSAEAVWRTHGKTARSRSHEQQNSSIPKKVGVGHAHPNQAKRGFVSTTENSCVHTPDSNHVPEFTRRHKKKKKDRKYEEREGEGGGGSAAGHDKANSQPQAPKAASFPAAHLMRTDGRDMRGIAALYGSRTYPGLPCLCFGFASFFFPQPKKNRTVCLY